ncbi:hypothetical protein F511_38335 [Dorcoceras hygrometricum]|uniref:Uncharacterized protein n=1 Tax=Dorcoceras hygrometricum TaxID=472368 RepID=A0A2Z7D3D0_9LAMI|nr:hypothetical protein F511_38335 [Dorcoceras hygrometricum]
MLNVNAVNHKEITQYLFLEVRSSISYISPSSSSEGSTKQELVLRLCSKTNESSSLAPAELFFPLALQLVNAVNHKEITQYLFLEVRSSISYIFPSSSSEGSTKQELVLRLCSKTNVSSSLTPGFLSSCDFAFYVPAAGCSHN